MSKTIFVVEDDALTARQIKLYIKEIGYQLAGSSTNAADALVQIGQSKPDLVLMDIHLKGAMDGIEAAAQLQANDTVAVIYLTAYADDDTLARARLTEPFAYLLKPFTRQELKASIEMGLYKSEMERERQRLLDAVVFTITEMIRLHDKFLNDMQRRAAVLAAAIARELKLSGREIEGIRLAALLHCVGLVGMPSELFSLRRPLLGVEKSYFQMHAVLAWNLLKGINFPQPVAEMVYQHMERLDGSGFPRGLSGDAILPGSRIVAVACKVAKMLTPHGIEPAASLADTIAKLEADSGKLFDTNVVSACVNVLKDNNFSFKDKNP